MIFLDPFIPKDFIFSIKLIMYFKFPFHKSSLLPIVYYFCLLNHTFLWLHAMTFSSCVQFCLELGSSLLWYQKVPLKPSVSLGFLLHAMYIDQMVSRVLLALPSDNPGYLHGVGVTRMNGSVNQSWCLSACLCELVSSRLNWLCVQLTWEVCVSTACVIVFIVDE